LLKPKGYRSDDDTNDQTEAVQHMTMDLKITVLAAQNIPLVDEKQSPNGFHPYIKCELHIETEEEKTGQPIENAGRVKDGLYKRKTHHRKGQKCDWNSEEMNFQGIEDIVEELSFLRFKIHDDEIGPDRMAAWACIRLDRLQQGYRIINLLDSNSVLTTGILLVKIEKNVKVKVKE